MAEPEPDATAGDSDDVDSAGNGANDANSDDNQNNGKSGFIVLAPVPRIRGCRENAVRDIETHFLVLLSQINYLTCAIKL